MISVIIPTLNAEATLAVTLASLIDAAVEGLVREVLVVDGGSGDRTRRIVDQAGAELIEAAPGRGRQLAEGAKRARMPWLLFLHADTRLPADWQDEVTQFIQGIENGAAPPTAAAFRFRLDDKGVARLRQVRLGEAVAGGELEVLAGIGSGERVSLTPLKAGIELKAAPAAAQ